ncbi:MAG: hypothetical protein ACYC2H_03235 [Thermoplasmatota archaeon]
MGLRDALVQVGKALHADVEEDGEGRISIEVVLARRQAGTLTKRLRYRIGVEADPASRTAFFQEWLWEDDGRPLDLAARLAEKDQAYRVSGAETPGNIESVATLFAQRYGTEFDFPEVRLRLRDACTAEGYQLRHLIPL